VSPGGGNQLDLVRVDRKGDIQPLKVPSGALGFPRASRDGKRVAYQIEDAKESSIWICEMEGNSAPRRLTLPGTGVNRYPIWSSDNQRVAFQSDREGDDGIWWQRADGSGTAERLTKPGQGATHIPDSWSPDGQTLSFTEEKGSGSEIWTYSLRDKKTAVLAAEPGASFGRSVFSPDGHWVAYQASAQPTSRIYVRPFPPTATTYVTPEDADNHHPAWSPDGKQLFYVTGPGQFASVTVTTQPTVSFGPPVRAPRSGFATSVPANARTFDVLPDGQHFIGVAPAGQKQSSTSGTPQIQVVLNWFDELKQRVPGN
jgi:Tol biopolymer transport system component